VSVAVRLLQYLRPYRFRVALGVICLIADVFLELTPGLLWLAMVDRVIVPRDVHPLPWIAGALAATGLCEALVSRARRILTEGTAQRFTFDLRNDLFAKVSRLPIAYFNESQTGDLISRISSDVDSIQDVVVNGTDSLLANFLRLLGVLIIFCTLNLKLGLASMAPLSLVALLLFSFNRRVKAVYVRARKQLGELTARLADTLGGIRVVKGFAREAFERDAFWRISNLLLQTNIEAVRARANVFPFVSFVAGLTNVVILGYGSWLIVHGEFTLGGLVAYRNYGRYFFGPIDNLSQINDMAQRAVAAGSRVFQVMDAPESVADAPEAIALPPITGHVEFRGVSFRYDRSDGLKPATLTDIDFELLPGHRVAIVGESGAGKSTIFALVQRFWDPTSGQVLIDGHDLKSVTQESLRRQVVSVQQDTFLFTETVRENIRYGRPDATDEQVEAAARAANAHGFISALQNGYDTVVGERGVKLSGGQRQRVSVARAFLAEGRLLILDEATSAVEPESERLIYESLQRLMSGRTALIATHRLSTIRGADLVLVVSEGSIVERGTHAQLMSLQGFYYSMVKEQEAGEFLMA
jgi:ABC-type multidrug transport system fused ATPase/permease subunit